MGSTTHGVNMKIFLIALLVAVCYATDCVEKDPVYCANNKNLCKQPVFVSFMKDVCPRTCGYCEDDETIYSEIAKNNPEYIIGQECIDINKECLGLATTWGQKLQCWVQFGICLGGKVLGCYKKCFPPLKTCKAAAGRDWLKNFQCAAAYIKCVTTDCK